MLRKLLLFTLLCWTVSLWCYNSELIYATQAQVLTAAGSSSDSSSSSDSGSSDSDDSGSDSDSGSGSGSSSTVSTSTCCGASTYDVLVTNTMIEDSDGITIERPGTHIMNTEVSFGGASGTCAITVATSNVTVDLNNRTLAYGGAAASGVHGVCVNAGVKNVVIKNGTIAGFPGNGINAPGTSGSKIDVLKIENITLVNNANGFVGTYINSGFVRKCDFNNNGSANNTYGVSLTNCNGCVIRNTNANHNVSSGAKSYGFYLSTSIGCWISKCVATYNQGVTETAGVCVVDSGSSKCNYVISCLSNCNTSTTGNGYGVLLSNASEAYVQFCEAKSNTASAGTSYGINLSSASNCHIEGNTIARQTYGIYDNESGAETNMFIQNTAYQNTTGDFSRPNGPEINFVAVKSGHLQDALAAGKKDNISIRHG